MVGETSGARATASSSPGAGFASSGDQLVVCAGW